MRLWGRDARGRCSSYVWHAFAPYAIMAPSRPLLSYVLSHLAFVHCLCVSYGYIYISARLSLLRRFPGVGHAGALQFVRVARASVCLHNMPSWLLLVLVFLACLTLRFVYYLYISFRAAFVVAPVASCRGRCSSYVWRARVFVCIICHHGSSSSFLPVSPCVFVLFVCGIFFLARGVRCCSGSLGSGARGRRSSYVCGARERLFA